MTLVFSIHYFLWYGAITSISGYESVYARHYTNSTAMHFGYLNMVLPFITVIAAPLVCSLADRRRSHRKYFTLSLIFTLISLCLYALLPLIMNKEPLDKNRGSGQGKKVVGNLLVGPWIYYCFNCLMFDLAMAVNNCLSDSFAVLQAEEHGSSFGNIIVWGTFGWALSAVVLGFINHSIYLPRLLPGLLFGAVILTIDIFVVTYWRRASDFKLDIIPIDAASSVTGSTSPSHKEPSDYMPSNESARINLGSEIDDKDGKRHRVTKSPIEILEDTAKRELKDEENLKSSLGDKATSVVTIMSDMDDERGAVNSPPSDTKNQRNPYETNVERSDSDSKTHSVSIKHDRVKQHLEGSDSGQENFSFRIQLVIFGLILKRRKSLIRYLILFVLSGFFMSMHWNYFFLYLEEIYYNKFELISALSMFTQSILGELPFLILSRKFIDFFGRSHTLSISVMSIGIRFLLYGYLLPNVNMYFIVIADAFQGPNYGLFYVVMTEVGLEFSYCDDSTVEKLIELGEIDRNNRKQVDSVRLALKSTVQSVAFACYEGIGVGLGSVVGGWVTNSYGFKTLWISMAIASITVGFINIAIEFSCRENDPEEDKSEQSEFMEARRRGMLEKVLSRPLPDVAKPPKQVKFPNLSLAKKLTKNARTKQTNQEQNIAANRPLKPKQKAKKERRYQRFADR